MYASYAAAFARVNRNHDIVLVDQRGTGNSAPLSCDYPDDWQAPDDPMPALRKATLDCLRKYGDACALLHQQRGGCRSRGGARGARVSAHRSLRSVVRHARGAAVHAALPQSVHAVILDGVTYPEQAIGPDTPLDGQRALDLIVARCAQIAGLRRGLPAIAAGPRWLAAGNSGRRSRWLTIDDPNERPAARRSNSTAACSNASLRFLSYNSTQASLLPTLIHRGGARRPGARSPRRPS